MEAFPKQTIVIKQPMVAFLKPNLDITDSGTEGDKA
jgi:hypothetical protein